MTKRSRTAVALVVVAALLAACGGGDDDAEAADSVPATTAATGTTGAATTAATGSTTSSATSAAPGTTAAPTTTTPSATVAPTTSAPVGTSSPATTVDDGGTTGEPADVGACELLDAARIESIFGGPVSEPTDLGTSCEWTVGEGAIGGSVPDVLSLVINGPANGQQDSRDLLGDDLVEVPQAGDGGVYWADFTTLFFDKDGRDLSLQFLAFQSDDPLGGLVALANLVG